MKPIVTLLIIISLCAEGLASGLGNLHAYQKYPQLHSQIADYAEKLRRALRVPRDSGQHLAAQFLVDEVEINLGAAGVSDEDLTQLREEVQSVFRNERVELDKFQKERSLITLLEEVDVIPRGELVAQANEVLGQNPRFLEILGKWPVSAFDNPLDDLGFRLYVGLVLMTAAEEKGYDFSSDAGKKSIDATLRVLNQFAILYQNSKARGVAPKFPIPEDLVIQEISNIPVPQELRRQLIEQWKRSNPVRRTKLLFDSIAKIHRTVPMLHYVPIAAITWGILSQNSAMLGTMVVAAVVYAIFLGNYYAAAKERHPGPGGEKLLRSCFQKMEMKSLKN